MKLFRLNANMKTFPVEQRKRVKRMFVLWIVSYCVYGAVATYFPQIFNNPNLAPGSTVYDIITIIVVLIYFLPLIGYVSLEAARAKMKGILIPSRIILIILFIWLIGITIKTVAIIC